MPSLRKKSIRFALLRAKLIMPCQQWEKDDSECQWNTDWLAMLQGLRLYFLLAVVMLGLTVMMPPLSRSAAEEAFWMRS